MHDSDIGSSPTAAREVAGGLTITYSVTPKDLEELRNRSVMRRIARVFAAVVIGLLAVLVYWQFWQLLRSAGWNLFWKHWQANAMMLALGTYLFWLATDAIGLNWLLARFGNAFAPREVSFAGDIVTITCGKRKRSIRWLRDRGCIDTPNVIGLYVDRPSRILAVPRRAFVGDQEQRLRGLLHGSNNDVNFVVQFSLKDAEVADTAGKLDNWSTRPSGQIALRAICALGAVFLLYLPASGMFKDVPRGWAGFWQSYPLPSVALVLLSLFSFWAAAGQPGIERLSKLSNHHAQLPAYTFTDAGIQLRRGDSCRTYSWRRILSFHETVDAFILENPPFFCCVIPKSALASYDVSDFRNFLLTKVPLA